MIKMIVFDMAGTTVNENNIVYKTVQKAINEQGQQVPLEDVLVAGAGKEKLQAIRSVLELNHIPDNGLSDKIFARFQELLKSAYETNTITGQPNATALFAELRKRNILVVLDTGYDRATAESLIKKIGWNEGVDYDLLVTASDVSNNRPLPDMIVKAMKDLNITDGRCVIKVGDSVIDIEEGRNAGCKYNIGITTGAQTRSQLEKGNPDYIIDDLLALLEIVDTENADAKQEAYSEITGN